VDVPLGFNQIQAADLVEWIAGGGGALPEDLRAAIQRRIPDNVGARAASSGDSIESTSESKGKVGEEHQEAARTLPSKAPQQISSAQSEPTMPLTEQPANRAKDNRHSESPSILLSKQASVVANAPAIPSDQANATPSVPKLRIKMRVLVLAVTLLIGVVGGYFALRPFIEATLQGERRADQDEAAAKRQAEAATQAQAEEAARQKAAADVKRRADEEAKAQAQADEAARQKAAADVKRRADEEAKAQAQADEAARQKAAADVKRRADEEAKAVQKQVPDVPVPTPGKVEEIGWVWLGNYDPASGWQSHNFVVQGQEKGIDKFPDPKDLKGKTVHVTDTTGQVNLRDDMPWPGKKTIDQTKILRIVASNEMLVVTEVGVAFGNRAYWAHVAVTK
jgi:hypothetical protein